MGQPYYKKGSAFAPIIYAKALDNIFVAMKNQRIFDRFGFNLPQQKETTIKLLFDFKTYIFNASATDWIDEYTGECLTGYAQPIELQYLLNDCVNIKSSYLF